MRAFLIWTTLILLGTVWLQSVANGYKEQKKEQRRSIYSPSHSNHHTYDELLDYYETNEANY